jgi:hypothetical protein
MPSSRFHGGVQIRESALDKVTIDWGTHGITPRWIGSETADCVAALQPGHYSNHGDRERERFLAGAIERQETALLISMLGYSYDDKPHSIFSQGGDSVDLARTMCTVDGTRLPEETSVKLSPGLSSADQDLAKRLFNRPAGAPWWSLKLDGITVQPGAGGPPQTYPTVGELCPLLTDPLGAPVVGVWVSPNEQIRWYVVLDDINWNVILDWLIHQAIPAYVPEAAKRHRVSSFVDTSLLTSSERAALEALDALETRYARDRAEHEAALTEARELAAPVREGLFYGKGADLVRAVHTVLSAAGFDVVDLDVELGDTRSADLLVTLGDHRRLVEVKSEGRNASESLVNDLLKHLQTWPELRPELPVAGGALVVNHQHRLPPDQRSPNIYTRPEFVATLTVPVVTVRDLFDWWKESDWPAIQQAVLGTTAPPPTHQCQPTSTTDEPPATAPPQTRARWRFGRGR